MVIADRRYSTEGRCSILLISLRNERWTFLRRHEQGGTVPRKPVITDRGPKSRQTLRQHCPSSKGLTEQHGCGSQPSLRALLLHRCEAERRRDAVHPVIDAVQDDAGPDRSGCPERTAARRPTMIATGRITLTPCARPNMIALRTMPANAP